MLVYALIGVCLVLVGVAGLQFTYLFYVDRMYRERRRYLADLEKRYSRISERLEAAEARLAETTELLETLHPELRDDDAWADVIEER